VEAVYTEAVGRTSGWLERQCADGMRGHHGDGQSAATVAGSGFLGWSMVHRAARQAGGRPVGDPHWPVHVTLANMTRGADGRWSTVAAGGRDLMRPAPAVDQLTQALVRDALHRRYEVSFGRNVRTGLWETVGVPAAALRAFAKRGASIEALLTDLGFDPGEASRAVQWVAEQRTRGARTEAAAAPDATLRELWQAEARAGGWDPAAIARRVLDGGGPDGADDVDGPRDPDHGPPAAGPQSIAALAGPAGRPGARADRAHLPVLPGGRTRRPSANPCQRLSAPASAGRPSGPTPATAGCP
jgi:conjugative relaxase-like TrwC/TraI family protein